MHGYLEIGASEDSAISVTVFIVISIFFSASENMSSGYSTILPVTPTNIAGLRTSLLGNPLLLLSSSMDFKER